MIEKIELKDIPFVDGVPAKGQESISWLVNKECLDGASKKGENTGNLNRAAVQIQKNVALTVKNVETVSEKLDETIGIVNTISEALNITEETDIVKTINETKDRVDIHEIHIQNAEDDIGVLERRVDKIETDVGTKSVLDLNTRTAFEDLYWLKTELGSYPGQNIQGIQEPGSLGSGMKKRIIDVSTQAAENLNRIRILESNWNDSDVGVISYDVQKLRAELGLETLQTEDSVYERILNLEDDSESTFEKIQEINTKIGHGNISEDVNKIKEDQNVIKTDISGPNGLKTRTLQLETKIGDSTTPVGLEYKVNSLTTNLSSVEDIVGRDTSSGLRGSVAWIENQVGLEDSPTPGSVVDRINVLTDTTNDLSISVQSMNLEIGTSKTGIKGDVAKNTKALNGTKPTGTTVTEIGVIKASEVSYAYANKGMPIPPEDGYSYVCRNKVWKKIPSSVGYFTKTLWEVKTETDIIVPLDTSLVEENCSLDNSAININDEGVYSISVKAVLPLVSQNINGKLVVKSGEDVLFEVSSKYIGNKTIISDEVIYKLPAASSISVHLSVEENVEVTFDSVSIQIKPII
ncbi:hypothetical protein [Providencia phage PSTRCR_121]|nr:hypothetical protein [Providencia phage PSTRCR_121]UGO50193.1 putative fibritin neck whiskers protein [Morganella phage vB_MmoM_Rgz1]